MNLPVATYRIWAVILVIFGPNKTDYNDASPSFYAGISTVNVTNDSNARSQFSILIDKSIGNQPTSLPKAHL